MLGGAFEATCLGLSSRSHHLLPSIASQGSRVGICFTVYSYLSNYSPLHAPYGPPPFSTALVYGTIAGLWGNGLLQLAESPASLLKTRVTMGILRGGIAVGFVISIQNELVRKVLGG